jgi:nicotinamide-nucleotide amidase
MKAEIIAIGSELVSGERLDTNSQWLSRELLRLGVPVVAHTSIGDDLEGNLAAFRTAMTRADLVVTSGGLGPTQDDLTREVLAAVAGVPLVEHAPSLAAIEALFARRNRPMSPRNRVQALVPRGAEALPNAIGTAPGLWMAVGGVTVACLPGVPMELKRMWADGVVPRLKERGEGRHVYVHRVVNLFGRGESDVEADALDLTARGRRPEVGITVHDATITLRVTCDGPDEDCACAEIEPTLAIIRERFADLIVGEAEGQDVPQAVARELARTGRTLALAESCTGGLAAARLTAIPGISAHFRGGVVAYSNDAKTGLLGVPHALIDVHGAVSAEVAEAMAAGARSRLGADLAVSITGVAGPDGGTPEKPVGLVYLGLATETGALSRRLEMGPEQPREVIQSRSAKHALNWARQHLRTLPARP